MQTQAVHSLDYARPVRSAGSAWWISAAAAVSLAAACFLTLLAYEVQEPIHESHLEDRLLFDSFPVALVTGWFAWAGFTFFVTRPRWVANVLLVIAFPLAVLSSGLALQARSGYKSDQLQVYMWSTVIPAAE